MNYKMSVEKHHLGWYLYVGRTRKNHWNEETQVCFGPFKTRDKARKINKEMKKILYCVNYYELGG